MLPIKEISQHNPNKPITEIRPESMYKESALNILTILKSGNVAEVKIEGDNNTVNKVYSGLRSQMLKLGDDIFTLDISTSPFIK